MISLKWDQLNCLHSVETIVSSANTSAKRIMWRRFLAVKPWKFFHGQIVIAIGRARKAVHSTIKIWGRTKAERSQLRHELKDMSVLRA